MGVFRLFFHLAKYIQANPTAIHEESLDKLCTVYKPYAYIGNRRSLFSFLRENIASFPSSAFPPDLEDASEEEILKWWLGSSRKLTDSGAFPDFVLLWENTETVGDGALLELKDSMGKSIASFNSTLPASKKLLSRLNPIVFETVRRVDKGPDERDCFYFVRTQKSNPTQVRISLVQGTFFETVPIPELLRALWQSLLCQAGMPEEKQSELLAYLTKLEREEIAQTRLLPRASVKPRLRIMSEIHAEANPHTYSEIPPRSLTLILKAPTQEEKMIWIQRNFSKEGIALEEKGDRLEGLGLVLRVFPIYHKRNGEHLVICFELK